MDEATSALDNHCELLITESLETLSKGRTTIAVAHKLSTILNYDSIVLISDGYVAEQGTHDHLISMNGIYARMFKRKPDSDPSSPSINLDRSRPILRESILTRKSVRLSIVPAGIIRKMKSVKAELKHQNRFSVVRQIMLGIFMFKYTPLGILASIALGIQMPAFALAMAGIVESFYQPTPGLITDGGQKWAIIYVGIGVGCIIFSSLQEWSLGQIGQNLSTWLKLHIYNEGLNQDMEWHDQKEHNASAIIQVMRDTEKVFDATEQMGSLIETFTATLISIFIAFTSSWSLSLVILSVLPVLAMFQVLQGHMVSKAIKVRNCLFNQNFDFISSKIIQFQGGSSNSLEHIFEAVTNIKTVHGYSLETKVLQTFTETEKAISSLKWNHYAGFFFGISQFILFNTISLAFWYGSRLLQEETITIQELMKAFCSLYFACFQISQQGVSYLSISGKVILQIKDMFAKRSKSNETEVQ